MEFFLRFRLMDQKGYEFMRQLKDKSKRLIKYWRVRYRQASGNERVFAGMFVMMLLVYTWWTILVF